MLKPGIPLDSDFKSLRVFKEVLKRDAKATAKQLKKAAGLELEDPPAEDGYSPEVLAVLDRIIVNRKNEGFIKALDEWLTQSGLSLSPLDPKPSLPSPEINPRD